jgi:hypothetical protein
MTRLLRSPLVRALAFFFVVACTTVEAPPAPTPNDRTPRYAVEFDTPAAAAGKPSVVKVRVEPRGDFHMNLDYPVTLDMTAPTGVDMSASRQRSADAERFDDQGLVFAVPFTPKSRGDKHFAGTVEFAVCGELSCAPEKVPVDFTVEVGCDTDAFC